MEDLKNKVVLITGGSSGIGRAAAMGFARRGARVVIASRGKERGNRVVQEIQAQGAEAIFVATDVSQADQVKTLVEKIVGTFGRLDCALNNAVTIEEPLVMTADYTEEQFDRSIAFNLKSVWLCMREQIKQMLAQAPAGGAIVNTSSVNGLGAARNAALYSAAKAGVLALTKAAALEYARQGIRVNALVAGAFRTPLLEEMMDRVSGGDPAAREEIEKRYMEISPLGRIGKPEEAAEAALWLCSEASSYVTGHSMIVDGGMTAPMR